MTTQNPVGYEPWLRTLTPEQRGLLARAGGDIESDALRAKGLSDNEAATVLNLRRQEQSFLRQGFIAGRPAGPGAAEYNAEQERKRKALEERQKELERRKQEVEASGNPDAIAAYERDAKAFNKDVEAFNKDYDGGKRSIRFEGDAPGDDNSSDESQGIEIQNLPPSAKVQPKREEPKKQGQKSITGEVLSFLFGDGDAESEPSDESQGRPPSPSEMVKPKPRPKAPPSPYATDVGETVLEKPVTTRKKDDRFSEPSIRKVTQVDIEGKNLPGGITPSDRTAQTTPQPERVPTPPEPPKPPSFTDTLDTPEKVERYNRAVYIINKVYGQSAYAQSLAGQPEGADFYATIPPQYAFTAEDVRWLEANRNSEEVKAVFGPALEQLAVDSAVDLASIPASQLAFRLAGKIVAAGRPMRVLPVPAGAAQTITKERIEFKLPNVKEPVVVDLEGVNDQLRAMDNRANPVPAKGKAPVRVQEAPPATKADVRPAIGPDPLKGFASGDNPFIPVRIRGIVMDTGEVVEIGRMTYDPFNGWVRTLDDGYSITVSKGKALPPQLTAGFAGRPVAIVTFPPAPVLSFKGTEQGDPGAAFQPEVQPAQTRVQRPSKVSFKGVEEADAAYYGPGRDAETGRFVSPETQTPERTVTRPKGVPGQTTDTITRTGVIVTPDGAPAPRESGDTQTLTDPQTQTRTAPKTTTETALTQEPKRTTPTAERTTPAPTPTRTLTKETRAGRPRTAPRVPRPDVPEFRLPSGQRLPAGEFPRLVEWKQGFALVRVDLDTGEKSIRRSKTSGEPDRTFRVLTTDRTPPPLRRISYGFVDIAIKEDGLGFEYRKERARKPDRTFRRSRRGL